MKRANRKPIHLGRYVMFDSCITVDLVAGDVGAATAAAALTLAAAAVATDSLVEDVPEGGILPSG